MAEQNLISASQQSDFYDFYTDDYCNKLRRRTFSKALPAKGEARPKKPHRLLIWRFLFYLLLLPTIIAVGATIPALQPIYQRGAELLSIPSLYNHIQHVDCVIAVLEAIIAGKATNNGMNGADLWLKEFGKLPPYYISESEALGLGWKNWLGNLSSVAPGKMMTKGVYKNRDGHLPASEGRVW